VCNCELSEIEVRLDACNSLHDTKKGLSDASCAVFAGIGTDASCENKTTGEAQQEHCAQSPWRNWDEDDYEGYLQRHVEMLQDWKEKNNSCVTASEATQKQKEECEAIQDEYNAKLQACLAMSPDPVPGYVPPAGTGGVATGGSVADSQPPPGGTEVYQPITPGASENLACAQYHCLNQACTDYDACYDAAMNAKETERSRSTDVTNSMMVTYVTLLRMKCLLNIIGMEGDQATEIDRCSELYRIGSAHVDTSLLTPTVLPYPDEEPCERLTSPSACVQVSEPRRVLGNSAARNLFGGMR